MCESTGRKTRKAQGSRPRIPLEGCTVDRPRSYEKGSSESMTRQTRKMVNYASSGRSCRKLRGGPQPIPTCKSLRPTWV